MELEKTKQYEVTQTQRDILHPLSLSLSSPLTFLHYRQRLCEGYCLQECWLIEKCRATERKAHPVPLFPKAQGSG